MNSISKSVYIDKSDYIVNKYNDTYHRTIKMRLGDVKSSTYVGFDKENNKESSKFKVSNLVRISKYKIIFTKDFAPGWSENIFVVEKVKITVSWTYVINDLNKEKIVSAFYKKQRQKANQKKFRVEKVIKQKAINVKWKSCNNYFNSWIDYKRHTPCLSEYFST